MNRNEAHRKSRYAFDTWRYRHSQGITTSTFQEFLTDTLYDAFSKELQDEAYKTYKGNIQYSKDLDMIFGSSTYLGGLSF